MFIAAPCARDGGGQVFAAEIEPHRLDLEAGDNAIEIAGGDYALDIDYLEITPAS